MKLNSNSYSARIYKWFYCTTTLPNNLCSYFWKMAIALILFIPGMIICVPSYLLEKIKVIEVSRGRMCMGTLIWFIIFLLIFGFYTDWYKTSMVLGLLILTIGVTIGCCILGDYIRDRRYENSFYPRKKKKPNLIVEYIKAKKNKYCPQITWEKENEI